MHLAVCPAGPTQCALPQPHCSAEPRPRGLSSLMTNSAPVEHSDSILEKIASFVLYLGDIAQLRRLTEHGMNAMFGSLRLFEKVRSEAGDNATPHQVQRVEDARRWTSAAQAEIDSDFALSNGHSLMGAWGALEAMVEDVCGLWALHTQAIHSNLAFARIKVNAVDFLGLSPAEQVELLLDELRRIKGTEHKAGVTQFESVLDDIGLGGPVDEGIKNSLYYAQQLRHLIAHRAGIADKRFVEACPNLGYVVGSKVMVSTDQFFDIVDAMQGYAVVLADRVRAAFGLKPTGVKTSRTPGSSAFWRDGNNPPSRDRVLDDDVVSLSRGEGPLTTDQ